MRVWALILIAGLPWPAFAAPIEGYWLGPVDPDGNQSTIEIYACEDAYCGKVAAVTQQASAYLLDQIILLDLKQRDEATYGGGTIRFDHVRWTFSGSIRMETQDQATLRGCWARVICQSVPFTRVAL